MKMRSIATPKLPWMLCVLLAMTWLGCGSGERTGGSSEGSRLRGHAEVGGEIVSTVDGHPITRAEVVHAAAGASVEPALALARLQDEAMLAQAAERAGWADDPDVERAQRRALVQALLARTVEADEVEVDPERLEQAYVANAARFDTPERRRSVAVLARTGGANDEAAARLWIAEVQTELTEAPDPAAAALAIRHRQLDSLPFGVDVQEISGLDRQANADPAYLEALFSLTEGEVTAVPVHTSLGWSVIVLTGVERAHTVGRLDALLMLRGEFEGVARAATLGRLVQEIVQERPVRVSPNALRLLDNPRIAGP